MCNEQCNSKHTKSKIFCSTKILNSFQTKEYKSIHWYYTLHDNRVTWCCKASNFNDVLSLLINTIYHCLSGIVVVGINRPKAKNAISKNLVKMVCIIFFPFFLYMHKNVKPMIIIISKGQSRVSVPVCSRRFTLVVVMQTSSVHGKAGYCYQFCEPILFGFTRSR